jgi:hypothetical protein
MQKMEHLMKIKDYSKEVTALNIDGRHEIVKQSSDNEVFSISKQQYIHISNYIGYEE